MMKHVCHWSHIAFCKSSYEQLTDIYVPLLKTFSQHAYKFTLSSEIAEILCFTYTRSDVTKTSKAPVMH